MTAGSVAIGAVRAVHGREGADPAEEALALVHVAGEDHRIAVVDEPPGGGGLDRREPKCN